MKFSRKDLVATLITGLTTGIIAWRIFEFLDLPLPTFAVPGAVSYSWLVIAVPVLWILGVNLGYFLGRWFGFFNQFGKFVALGFTNAAVDFGILNLLIFLTGTAAGGWFPIFKVAAFVGAMTHSYLWNRFWVFESGTGQATEFAKFFGVTIAATALNVSLASLIVFGYSETGLDPKRLANIASVAGSAVALLFSFTGYRILVFRRKKQI